MLWEVRVRCGGYPVIKRFWTRNGAIEYMKIRGVGDFVVNKRKFRG